MAGAERPLAESGRLKETVLSNNAIWTRRFTGWLVTERHMRTNSFIQYAILIPSLLVGPNLGAQEQDIQLADVPAVVIEAAETAVEGLQITSAEIEVEDDQTVYELEGTADGSEYEIEVSADGQVLEIETDD